MRKEKESARQKKRGDEEGGKKRGRKGETEEERG